MFHPGVRGAPNNSFKPNLLRYTNNVAGKACHVVGYATQVGLTQALGSMDSSTRLHIIYTEADMRLSKRQYQSWREIQDEYQTYKASLGPWPADEVVEYLTDEYSKLHPSASEQVAAFVAGGEETHVVTFGG